MSCERTHAEQKTWVNDWTGDTEVEYVMVQDCVFVDTSLHGYQCTTCGQQFWYSTRGRVSEELGIPLMDINGDGTLRKITSD